MLLTPGPAESPKAVQAAMAAKTIHHRSPAFAAIFAELQTRLRVLFGGFDREVLVFNASGSGAMDAACRNLLGQGDEVTVLVGGKFGSRFAEYASGTGARVQRVEANPREELDLDALFGSIGPATKALMVTATETATGSVLDLKGICEGAKAFDDLLLVVDGIAWLGSEEQGPWLERVDVMLGASQKAIAGPTGLSFAQLSERAWGRVVGPSGYFDFQAISRAQSQGQSAYSMPSQLIAATLAGAAWLQDRAQSASDLHASRARVFRERATIEGLELLPLRPANALSALLMPEDVSAEEVRSLLLSRHDFEVAGGQGPWADRILRVGHMGALDEAIWGPLASAIAEAIAESKAKTA